MSSENINLSLYNISRRIKLLRTSRNLMQKELGELIGVSKSTISSYENDTKCPSLDKIIRLSDVFGVTTDELLGVNSENLGYIDYDKELDNIVSLKDLSSKDRVLVKNIIKHLRSNALENNRDECT